MLVLWHQLCQDVLGGDLEVGIANRHDYGPTKHFHGELNLQVPMVVSGTPMMVLLFEATSSVEDILLTHELGHAVLKLQGFKSIRKTGQPHIDEEIFFNSMCQNPALYVLQRSIGHDPQHQTDARAKHTLHNLKPAPYTLLGTPPGRFGALSAKNVLLVLDDVLNCSPEIAEALLAKLDKYSAAAASYVRNTREIRNRLDPAKLVSHPAFVQAAMQEFGLDDGWGFADEIQALKTLLLP